MTINKNKGQAAFKAENALKAAHMRTVRVRMAEGHMNTKKQNGTANTITNRKNALIILNAVAGKKFGAKYLAGILDVFCLAGYECTVQLTSPNMRGNDIVRKFGKGRGLIVCIGGDGTYNEVVSAVVVLGLDTPIGYIPTGSTNDFASSLKLPLNPVRAAESIVKGTPQNIDIGMFGNRIFTYVASCGAFTKASYSVERDLKNTLGYLAYVLEGIKEVPTLHPEHIKLCADGRIYEGDYIFAAICNSTSFGGIFKINKQLVDLNDGKFEVMLIKNPENPIELAEILRGINSHNYDCPGINLFSTKEIRMLYSSAEKWSVDGEMEVLSSKTPNLKIRNLHNAVKLVLSGNQS